MIDATKQMRRSIVVGEEGRLFSVPSVPLTSVDAASLAVAMAGSRPSAAASYLDADADVGSELLRRCRRGRTRFGAALAHEIRSSHRLCVFGDYDVDGMASTSSMLLALSRVRSALEGSVFEGHSFAESALRRGISYMVPERRHGYGLSVSAVESMRMAGVETVVCCDNGANARDALVRAADLGMAVLVVDHHPLSTESESFWAAGGGRRMMVNPRAPGPLADLLESMGLPLDMCAAMVVDLVVAELFDRVGVSDDLRYGQMLAGLATVTDVMPMTGQNRMAVRRSLAMLLDGGGLPGVDLMLQRHLVSQSVLAEGEVLEGGLDGAIDADFFGFVLGPRLNACGRTGNASMGTSLILATGDRSFDLAQRVERLNDLRKEMESSTMRAVLPLVREAALLPSVLEPMVRFGDPAVLAVRHFEHGGSHGFFVPGVIAVIVSPACESGIAGLAASKVSDMLRVPAVVMSVRQGDDGRFVCSGSGRVPASTPASLVSVGQVAARVSRDVGGGGGGHAVAFGLHVSVDDAGDSLSARIGAIAAMMADAIAADIAALGPEVVDGLFAIDAASRVGAEATCDATVLERDLGSGLVRAIGQLGPFGRGFESPLVHIDVGPSAIRKMGQNGSFMVALNGVRGGESIAVKGFAKDFGGGLSGGALAAAEARLPSEGCGLIGRVKPSFFGRGRAVSSRRPWGGPTVEVVLDAIVERHPVS